MRRYCIVVYGSAVTTITDSQFDLFDRINENFFFYN